MMDDKGGEYMSRGFITFTEQCGIQRLHSVRNRPQQNGVAEHANRTISKHATAMLYEAGLPPSFLGESVDAYITVQNKCPMNSLSEKMPYELWHGRKPDVSNIQVWGCAAYVHVQKDKRIGINSHMEKCIFIGYPEGFKAWKFYNPVTKRVVVSERAEFDEWYFPGLKHIWGQPRINPTLPLVVSEYQTPIAETPDVDGDDCEQSLPHQPSVELPLPPTIFTSPATSPTPALTPSQPPELMPTITTPRETIPTLLQR